MVSAWRAPHQSPAPDVCPIRVRARAASSSAGVPRAREVRRELRQHLAVERALDQRRRQQCRAVENRGHCGGHVVGEAVGRRPAPRASRTARRRPAGSGRRRCRRARAGSSVSMLRELGKIVEGRDRRVGGEPVRLRPVAGGPVPRGAQASQSGRRARQRLRPVGGAAPPHSPGSPPDQGLCGGRFGVREHPRIVRSGGGDRSDTGSRAQHRGSAAPPRAPRWATRPRPHRRA